MTPLRIAVVGAGYLGSIHARLIAANRQAQLVAIVDPIESSRVELARRHDSQHFADHREVIERIDAAIIATPTNLHDVVGLDFIHHGKHVLIEKPIASTVSKADQLVWAARERRIVLQVGHVEQFNAAWTAGSRDIVNPRYIESRRCGPFAFRSVDVSVVHDLMIHDLELVLSLVDSRVEHITAVGTSTLTRNLDQAAAWITFASGCVAQLTASRIHDRPVREMRVIEPTRQTFIDFANSSVTTMNTTEEFAQAGCRIDELDPAVLQRTRTHGIDCLLRVTAQSIPAVNAIAREQDDFIESIVEHREPRVTGERARDALRLAERVIARIRDGSSGGKRRFAA